LPTPEYLSQTIDAHARARKTQCTRAEVCPARDYAEAIACFHWEGPRESVDLSVATPRPNTASASGSAIPVALIGGPLPRAQWHLIDVIERTGARVVLNGTEAGERSLWTSPSSEDQVTPGATSVSSLRLWLAQ